MHCDYARGVTKLTSPSLCEADYHASLRETGYKVFERVLVDRNLQRQTLYAQPELQLFLDLLVVLCFVFHILY